MNTDDLLLRIAGEEERRSGRMAQGFGSQDLAFENT